MSLPIWMHQLRPSYVIPYSKLRKALLDRLADRLALCALALDALLSPAMDMGFGNMH